jgi:hypothetical protein
MASGFAHLDSRDVHQDFYGHDVLTQSNQPQFTQLDPSQTISYAISETDHSGMYSGGIVPAILPQIASGDNNCTSSLIAPGTGVIKHIHQAPLMLPTTDSLFGLQAQIHIYKYTTL